MRKFFMIQLVMLVALVFATQVMAGSSPKGKPFVELQGQVVEVSNSVFDLEQAVADLTVRVDSNEERITVNEEAIANLSAKNDIISAQIVDIISTAAANNQVITDMVNRIDQIKVNLEFLNTDVAANQYQISTLEAELATAYDFIALNTEGVLSLKSEIDENFQVILELESQIEVANAEIAKKQNFLNAECPSGTALNGVTGDSYTCTSELATQDELTAVNDALLQEIEAGRLQYNAIWETMNEIRYSMQSYSDAINALLNQSMDLQMQVWQKASLDQFGTEQDAVRMELEAKQLEINAIRSDYAILETDLYAAQAQLYQVTQNLADLNAAVSAGGSGSYGLRVHTVFGLLEVPAAEDKDVTRCTGWWGTNCTTTEEKINGYKWQDSTCPDGTLIMSGGWNTYPYGMISYGGYQRGSAAWRHYSYNHQYSPISISTFANCMEVYEK